MARSTEVRVWISTSSSMTVTPRLHDLVVRPVGTLGEAESVAADHHAVLQDHAIADAAELAHDGVRVRVEIVADLRALIDHDVRMQHGVASDSDSRPTHAKGPIDAFSPTTAVSCTKASGWMPGSGLGGW